MAGDREECIVDGGSSLLTRRRVESGGAGSIAISSGVLVSLAVIIRRDDGVLLGFELAGPSERLDLNNEE